MLKNKTGGGSSHFPKPQTSQSESGKKLQALFAAINNKKSIHKFFPEKKSFTNIEKQPTCEDFSKKREKKKKHKLFSDANSERIVKISEYKKSAQKVHEEINFPRTKSKAFNKNNEIEYYKQDRDDNNPIQEQQETPNLFNENVEGSSVRKSKKKRKLDNTDSDLFKESTNTIPKKKKNKQRDFENSIKFGSENSDADEKFAKFKGSSESHVHELGKISKVESKKRKRLNLSDSTEVAVEDNSKHIGKKRKKFASQDVLPHQFSPLKEKSKIKIERKHLTEDSPRGPARHNFEFETEEKIKCTLFVGNLPMEVTKRDLKKLFSEFGPMQSVRFRRAIPTKLNISKKVAEIQKKFHNNQHSRIGYVVFANAADARAALKLNGTLMRDHHIVVDKISKSGQQKLYDKKTSIFVGNLPFDVEDEELRSTFSYCGIINSVRVVRDAETGVGKGFGYVSFNDPASVEKALAETEIKINERILRINPIQNSKTKNSSQKMQQWSAVKRSAIKERIKGDKKKSLKKLIKRNKIQHQKKSIAKLLTKKSSF